MSQKYSLGAVDYVIIAITLLISAAIGIKFRFTGGRQATAKEFLLAGKDMSRLPVIMSISVTLISAITMLGVPAEVYVYGFQYFITAIGATIGMPIAAVVFIPVYFQCGVSTVHEFMELRFGKCTRYALSAAFLIQAVMYMAAVLYAPAIALSAVTDLSPEVCNVILGGICTFYCCLGGLKAVLWSDAFQAILMFTFFVAFLIAGIGDAGGMATIIQRASETGRLNIFKFNFDLTTRYTFWNCLIEGIILGATFGTNQLQVQRIMSLGSSKKAKTSLQISAVLVFILRGLALFSGLILFALFYLCDPVMNKCNTGLTRHDQLIPYYIMRRFSAMPGLTGLCMAGIFSGSLSSISSAINCLANVTVVNYIQPVFTNLSEKKTVFVAKALCVFYGVLCVCLTFAFGNIRSLTQIAITLYSSLEGPILALFTIGVLTRRGTDKSVMIGMLISYPIICWISFGSLFSGYREAPLPLSIDGCYATNNFTNTLQNMSDACYHNYRNFTAKPMSLSPPKSVLSVYKISFVWLAVMGSLFTFISVLLVSLITGWKQYAIPADSKCLSPITRFWIKKPEYSPCTLLTNGTADEIHEEKNSILLTTHS